MRILISIIVILLSACSSLPEDYEFGDGTRAALDAASKIIKLKQNYCSADSEETRELILTTIKLADPDYKGLCEEG